MMNPRRLRQGQRVQARIAKAYEELAEMVVEATLPAEGLSR